MKKKIVVLLSVLVLILANNLSALPTSAESKVEVMNSENVAKNLVDVEVDTTLAKGYEILDQQTDFVLNNTVQISEKKKQKLLNTALKAIEKKKANYHNSNPNVLNNPEIRAIDYGEGQIHYTVAFSAIDEENMERLSLFNIAFDSKYKIIGTFEVDMIKKNDDEASLKYWINGKVENDEIVDISNYKEQSTDEVQLFGWTSCMQKCLAGKGMTMWAISLLAVICGASCTVGIPATAGTACYACVNTAGLIGVTAFSNCHKKCW